MEQQTIMLALFIALGVVLVAGLVVVPVIDLQEADAKRCKTENGVTICKLKKL
jgi:hypothetical protein